MIKINVAPYNKKIPTLDVFDFDRIGLILLNESDKIYF